MSIEGTINFLLQNSQKTFVAATEEMSKFNISKAETLLQENLEQLSGALCPPYRDYHLTQECYLRCVLYTGNTRVMRGVGDTQDKEE